MTDNCTRDLKKTTFFVFIFSLLFLRANCLSAHDDFILLYVIYTCSRAIHIICRTIILGATKHLYTIISKSSVRY